MRLWRIIFAAMVLAGGCSGVPSSARRAECFDRDGRSPIGRPKRPRDDLSLACSLGRTNHAG